MIGADGGIVEILTGTMEHHISADIAYAVWQYWRASGDDDFLFGAGAEILLETARFWASRAIAEPDGKRHIRHVIGPDEYHEDVDDNAFTNVMARWNIGRALEALDLLQANWPAQAAALRQKLSLGDDELADWRDAVERLVTGLDPATGIYEQFAGFNALEPLDLAAYAGAKMPIDVVIKRQRTQRSHGLVAARLGDAEMALRYLHKTAALDLDPDPNSAGGVRIAGLGGMWQTVILGFGGVDLMGDTLEINPKIPPQWRSLSFQLCWKGRVVAIRIAGGSLQATLVQGDTLDIIIAGATHKLTAGAKLQVST